MATVPFHNNCHCLPSCSSATYFSTPLLPSPPLPYRYSRCINTASLSNVALRLSARARQEVAERWSSHAVTRDSRCAKTRRRRAQFSSQCIVHLTLTVILSISVRYSQITWHYWYLRFSRKLIRQTILWQQWKCQWKTTLSALLNLTVAFYVHLFKKIFITIYNYDIKL